MLSVYTYAILSTLSFTLYKICTTKSAALWAHGVQIEKRKEKKRTIIIILEPLFFGCISRSLLLVPSHIWSETLYQIIAQS